MGTAARAPSRTTPGFREVFTLQTYRQLYELATNTALSHQPDEQGRCPHCGVPNCERRQLAEQARRRYARHMTEAPAEMSTETALLFLAEHPLDDSGLCRACGVAPCRIRAAAQLVIRLDIG